MKFLLKMIFWARWEKIVVNVNKHGMGQSRFLYLKNINGGDVVTVTVDKVQMSDKKVETVD